ncbi:hypothetical protein NOM01_11155 [Sporolactobacillus sp. STSJ-5]|uniref:hypothetical protein n=1 Tax=Sporolactobacillus sp. STSJ-5 TaxID=2965076 RepID=UPI0021037487|nr:hypothetical protein [Sporolactobacillus sp. STSJ-5]MCQ2010574.1 hypothetical protein [Sporolactobacillus sp. STSJ-5]
MAFSTALTKINDTFAPMIENQLTGSGIKMDTYSKQCVLSAIAAINNVLDSKLISWNDEQLDKSNVTDTLLQVAALKLNAAASPREVYFQLRNVGFQAQGSKDKVWKKQIEMGIEGDGNDSILARFGRDVKSVKQFWMIRENDKFEYPSYNGLEMTSPKWTPSGTGKVIRVVYPIIKTDDTVEYYIAERADVARNLIAHISNNLMNETFGIAESRYKATAEQKKEISKKKKELLKKASDLGLDALDDPSLSDYISPAWKDPQSRETMIIRKMRNNIVKKIPKDFGNALIQMSYEETDGETSRVRKEIATNANRETIDVEVSETGSNQEEEQPNHREKAEPIHKNEPIQDNPKAEEQETRVEDDPAGDFEKSAAAGGPGF